MDSTNESYGSRPHMGYTLTILETIKLCRRARTGIAEHAHTNTAATKMKKEGKAIIALCGDTFMVYYIESWGNKQYVWLPRSDRYIPIFHWFWGWQDIK